MDNIKATFQAVIFDLDGTLLNTLEDIADAVDRMLSEFGFSGHTLDDYRRFIGNGIKLLVTRALPAEGRAEELVDACVKRARDLYWEHWNRKTHPYKGIRKLLHDLEDRNIPKAVLSNKPHDFTARYINAYFPDITFETVMGQSDLFPIKPDPAAALEIARRIGIPPSNFVFVGDSVVDVRTALSAGMYAVGVAWGFKGVEGLAEAGCQTVAKQTSEILNLFSSLSA